MPTVPRRYYLYLRHARRLLAARHYTTIIVAARRFPASASCRSDRYRRIEEVRENRVSIDTMRQEIDGDRLDLAHAECRDRRYANLRSLGMRGEPAVVSRAIMKSAIMAVRALGGNCGLRHEIISINVTR